MFVISALAVCIVSLELNCSSAGVYISATGASQVMLKHAKSIHVIKPFSAPCSADAKVTLV